MKLTPCFVLIVPSVVLSVWIYATPSILAQLGDPVPVALPPPPPPPPPTAPPPAVVTPAPTPIYNQANPTITPLDQHSGLTDQATKTVTYTVTPINLTVQTIKPPTIVNANLLAPTAIVTTQSQPNTTVTNLTPSPPPPPPTAISEQPTMVGNVTAIPPPPPPPRVRAAVPTVKIISTAEVNRQNKIATELDAIAKEMKSVTYATKYYPVYMKVNDDSSLDAGIVAFEKRIKDKETELGATILGSSRASLLAAKTELWNLKFRLADARVKEIKFDADGMLEWLGNVKDKVNDRELRKTMGSTLTSYEAKAKVLQDNLAKKTIDASDYNAKTDAVEALNKLIAEIASVRTAYELAGGAPKVEAGEKLIEGAKNAFVTVGETVNKGITKFFNLFRW